MKKYNILWTKQAALDLEEIYEYIYLDKPDTAQKILNKIKTSCITLKNNPEKNRIIPDIREIGLLDFRELIVAPYRILYKLTKNEIYIFAVVDGRRDMESFLFNRIIRS